MILTLTIILVAAIVAIAYIVLFAKKDYSGFSNTAQSKIAAGLFSSKYIAEIREGIVSNALQHAKEKEKANQK